MLPVLTTPGNQGHFPQFWKKTKVITPREFIHIVAPHLILLNRG